MDLYNGIKQAVYRHKIGLHIDEIISDIKIRYAIRWVMRDNPD